MKARIARFLAVFLIALTSSGFLLAKDSILLGNRNPDAPQGLDQFGQFAGTWKCAPASRQPDGSIQESPLRPRWVWNYALNGMAIQDVWIPDAENAPAGSVMGTNLRVYNTETDSWEMVWTTETMGGFQTFKSSMEDGNMVMHGDLPAGVFPAHLARITFHNITEQHFDWKYEASAPGDGETWQLQSTLSCDRQD